VLLWLLCCVAALAELSGCQSHQIGNPTPADLLKADPAADIFLWQGIVCENATDIPWVSDWVKQHGLEDKSYVGQIERTGVQRWWRDADATKLPVGTPIYELSSGLMAAVTAEATTVYLRLIEG
jgi:hypothetical protein